MGSQLLAAFAAGSESWVIGDRFFSLRCRLVFFTFVAAQRACFFRENDPYRFVGRPADPPSLRCGLVLPPAHLQEQSESPAAPRPLGPRVPPAAPPPTLPPPEQSLLAGWMGRPVGAMKQAQPGR